MSFFSIGRRVGVIHFKTGTMSKKEITLCGKQVTLAYCYATEIAFKDMSNQDITDFMIEAVPQIQAQKMPDAKKVVLLIVAALMSYYQSIGEETPIEDKDIMYRATSKEIGNAIGVVIGLRADFYHIPSGEPEDKPKDGDAEPKND